MIIKGENLLLECEVSRRNFTPRAKVKFYPAGGVLNSSRKIIRVAKS